MIPLVILSLGGLARYVSAQAYEPSDFNVTAALGELGIEVSELPPLASLEKRGEKGSGSASCSAACSTLSLLYGKESVLAENDAAYDTFTSSYWSAFQNEVSPRCIFKPSTTEDVSAVVLLSRLTQCPFAVKSGGHAAFAGGSSSEGGITIALEKLNQVKLSCKKKRVTIGPGNRWADVYRKLDPHELTVAGGRVSNVGTGGLTLGGGISFFSNKHGWACDNVLKYEVVTAAGYVLKVTPKSDPELYWALRGGGNNFGIVTAFTFEAIPLPKAAMWGGTKSYLENSFDEVADAFADLIASSPKDPHAGTWVAWLKNSGMKIAATELWYTKPDGDKAAIFDKFNNITAIADSTQNRIVSDYTDVLDVSNPYGLREIYYGLTVKADAKMAKIARDIFFEELPATEGVAGANPVLIFQGITEGQIAHMSKNGGNALGINLADGPLYIIHVASWWEKASDDKTIFSFADKVLRRIKAESKKRGVANDYIYTNYASAFENAIGGYGPKNVAKLKKIAASYDPTGVFQKLQPGGFKLDRAPIPNSGYFSG
ncbi:FAD binding domain-containing protein [Sarocladium implicatum]|nr:FAD binding domain-containing protein [Sarocladium implicatum]